MTAKACIIEESHQRERKERVGGGLNSVQKMQKCFPESEANACDFNRESCKTDFLHYVPDVLSSLFLFTLRNNKTVLTDSILLFLSLNQIKLTHIVLIH